MGISNIVKGGFLSSLVQLLRGRKRTNEAPSEDRDGLKVASKDAVRGAAAALRSVLSGRTKNTNSNGNEDRIDTTLSHCLPRVASFVLPDIIASDLGLDIHIDAHSESSSTIALYDDALTEQPKPATIIDEVFLNPNLPAPPPLPTPVHYVAHFPWSNPRQVCSTISGVVPRQTAPAFRFLDLPSEIRLLVYKFLWKSTPIMVMMRLPHPLHPHNPTFEARFHCNAGSTQILRVCRQVYDEASIAVLDFAYFDFMTRLNFRRSNLTTRHMHEEMVARIKRFKCDDAKLVRKIWKLRRSFEKKALSDVNKNNTNGDIVLSVPGKNDRQGIGCGINIGTLEPRTVKIGPLKEIILLQPRHIFHGLTLPVWATEKWFSDEDTSNNRILNVIELRCLLEDFRKHANNGLKLRLKPKQYGCKNREIELRSDGTVIVRGVPSAWHIVAGRKVEQWLQLSEGNTIRFEDI